MENHFLRLGNHHHYLRNNKPLWFVAPLVADLQWLALPVSPDSEHSAIPSARLLAMANLCLDWKTLSFTFP